MSTEWFYTKNGQDHCGPFSSSELKRLAESGAIDPNDMISRKGETRWIPAFHVKGLFEPREKISTDESAQAYEVQEDNRTYSSFVPTKGRDSSRRPGSTRTVGSRRGFFGKSYAFMFVMIVTVAGIIAFVSYLSNRRATQHHIDQVAALMREGDFLAKKGLKNESFHKFEWVLAFAGGHGFEAIDREAIDEARSKMARLKADIAMDKMAEIQRVVNEARRREEMQRRLEADANLRRSQQLMADQALEERRRHLSEESLGVQREEGSRQENAGRLQESAVRTVRTAMESWKNADDTWMQVSDPEYVKLVTAALKIGRVMYPTNISNYEIRSCRTNNNIFDAKVFVNFSDTNGRSKQQTYSIFLRRVGSVWQIDSTLFNWGY